MAARLGRARRPTLSDRRRLHRPPGSRSNPSSRRGRAFERRRRRHVLDRRAASERGPPVASARSTTAAASHRSCAARRTSRAGMQSAVRAKSAPRCPKASASARPSCAACAPNGHALLGRELGLRRRRGRPARCSTADAPDRPPICGASAARRRDPRRQRDAEPRRLLQRARHRARARGATQRVPLRQPEPTAASPTIYRALSRWRCAPESTARASSGACCAVCAPAVTSPLWLRERLRRADVRAIHPVVDVTNYVMLELGQPLHAYDLDKLDERIEVRFAKPGESLVLLDGKKLQLGEDVLVIADARGPIGARGHHGRTIDRGDAATKSIFFESRVLLAERACRPGAALWLAHRRVAAFRARRRSERPDARDRARDRAARRDLRRRAWARRAWPSGRRTCRASAPVRAATRAQSAVLGIAVRDRTSSSCSSASRCASSAKRDGWRVTPPAFRFDVAIEEDLIEEIGRMLGYDRDPVDARHSRRPCSGTRRKHACRRTTSPTSLAARGYAEVVTYSFVDPALDAAVSPRAEAATLANPIASDMAVLRARCGPGLIARRARESSVTNARASSCSRSDRSSRPSAPASARRPSLAGLAVGAVAPGALGGAAPDVDFFDVKGDSKLYCRARDARVEFRFRPRPTRR